MNENFRQRVEIYPQEAATHNSMLELGPTCENCNKALPADSLEARICTYECTVYAVCVDGVLENVCPNCGGGFVPASTTIKHRPVDPSAHARSLQQSKPYRLIND
jgi:hypothetical protein